MMNAKKHLWNRLLTALLIAALLLVPTIPAFATGGEPSPDSMEVTPPAAEQPTTPPDDREPDNAPDNTQDGQQEGTMPPVDDGEGSNTPEPEVPTDSPETGFVTVSTFEELLQAIDQAEDGATIGIGCEIICPDGVIGGADGKVITIKRTAPEGHISFYSHDGSSVTSVQYINFDGGNVESSRPFVEVNTLANFIFCRFSNCTAGAVAITTGSGDFTYCTFLNNTAQQGAHIRIDNCSATFNTCDFYDGIATIQAGAIACYTNQSVTLNNCSVQGNTAAQHGGGIWNQGNLTISQCRIANNTVNGEPDDIVNEYQGHLALMDDYNALVEMYAPYNLTPNKWMVDTFLNDSSTQNENPNMVFSMTFVTRESDPAPSPEPTPDPTPTPEPDPTPTPDPIPTPEPSPVPDPVPEPPSRPSNGGSSYTPPTITTPTVEPEKPKAPATLTNGKAVLVAPEALYWAGYNDSRGGGTGTVTRADLALLVLSMMDQASRGTLYTQTVTFNDVAPGEWSAPAIGAVSKAGIMVGCGNNLFCPDRLLTWGELITVFSRFTAQGSPPAVYTGDHWARDSINTAISFGWIEYTEAFDPSATVTCGEMVAFIQTVFQWSLE